ncbi:MAG TPA: alanine--tRNA ligase [Solirubrobacterales bacterium]|jgi:alanyl-tRNA synthetase|nr:alanine--tRNA ligase [Solirubrobacterales bacterium]
MKAQEIRDTYLSFFAERGHKVVPSASLVPSSHDPSVLLTTAGMQPFKAYFLGREKPPAPRLTDVQKCFRTTDIEEVGNTARHLTFFEMLGNWSFGDYFKAESIRWGWELSTQGFGMDPERIWVTVFGGDEELGLGSDEEAIEIWRAVGVPDERIVQLGREDNFWQAGPSGPCGPCSELYLDRGEAFGAAGERPGDDTDRFLEFWNHVFMSYDLAEDGGLAELPMRNIDTGMGLDRMAAILQDVPSVYETDHVRPLIDLAEEMSGHGYEEGDAVTRAMRIVADHSRGAAFLIADGVVPSNEDRGYILRRIMRRAIQQGNTLGLEAPWLGRFAERTIELMGEAYPELVAERETIARWVGDEEESFGRTLERGTELLERLVVEAKESGTSWIDAADAFKLHDTYGFPYDLTKELLADRGLSVDDSGFEELMEEQRQRARSGAATAHGSEDSHEKVIAFAAAAPPTRFVGYETLRVSTGLAAMQGDDGRALVKLEESPFYAEGGGQVADSGLLRWDGREAEVLDVYRVGEDQVLEVEAQGGVTPGTAVEAVVDRETRHATMRNHTATHLLHAALRERLGTHVRQAGSAVRPDKLRFDFTHGQALSPAELRDVEDRVNEWIKASAPVRWMNMERPEAEKLGAMALFGEKYGEWVRVVEVDGVSRELCGGTHVANTAEVGIFKIAAEGSSAANVRRIEALSGPAAIDWFREREGQLREAGELLGNPQHPLAAARRAAEQLREAGEGAKKEEQTVLREEVKRLASEAVDMGGLKLVSSGDTPLLLDSKQLLDLAKRIQSAMGGGGTAITLGGAGAKASIVILLSEAAVDRGLSAAELIRRPAEMIGGGGGGSDGMAQAGGRDSAKLGEALAAARGAIERELG